MILQKKKTEKVSPKISLQNYFSMTVPSFLCETPVDLNNTSFLNLIVGYQVRLKFLFYSGCR